MQTINTNVSIFLLTFSVMSCISKGQVNGLTEFEKSSSVSDFATELWIGDNTFKGSFSDDFNTFYFFRKDSAGIEKYTPYQSKFVNGKWESPTIADYYEKENSYTYQMNVPGKNELIFISNKRTEKDTTNRPNYNFWEIEIVDNKYKKPSELGYLNLIYNYNSQPSITKDKTIYFTSDLPDWSKTLSYKMEFIDGKYGEPELFETVNNWRDIKNWKIFEYCVAPDENYMIICIQENDREILSTDLYISHYIDKKWTLPEKLKDEINSNETENFPMITNDGKYLIFTRGFSEFKIISTKKLHYEHLKKES